MSGRADATSPRPLHRARTLFVVAIWTALATGAVQLLVIAYRWFATPTITFFSRDVFWMAPVAYLLTFGAAALVLAVVAVAAPRLPWFRIAAFLFGTLGIFSLLLPVSQLARYASLLLSLGVGVQFARVVGAAPDRWEARLRRGAVGLAVVLGLVATVERMGRMVSERRALSALPAASAGAPNVLLIILDTVRAASMSLHGHRLDTSPEIARWARGGVVFDKAFATSPWTLPTHASIFTGVDASQQSGDWMTPLDGTHRTLTEVLARRGYRTGGFVANLHYTTRESGLARGFARYEDHRTSFRQMLRSTWLWQTQMLRRIERDPSLANIVRAIRAMDLSVPPKLSFDRKPGDEVTNGFLEWQRADSTRPFFAFLNYFDAHAPYRAPGVFRTKFGEPKQEIDLYDGAIAYLDHEVGRLLEELARRGVLDNTIVVVTSDHGELLGEHELYGHAHNMYLPVLQVPLVLRYPARIPPGVRVGAAVSLRDVPATVLDLAGATERLPGTSLVATWRADSAATSRIVLAEVSRAPNIEARYPTSRGPMQSLADSRHHYIRNGDGEEELYAYVTDPAESLNLAQGAAGDSLVAPWRERLRQILERLHR